MIMISRLDVIPKNCRHRRGEKQRLSRRAAVKWIRLWFLDLIYITWFLALSLKLFSSRAAWPRGMQRSYIHNMEQQTRKSLQHVNLLP